MAKLRELPDVTTIRSAKGRVDFYLWNGIPVARRWPRYGPRAASGLELTSQQQFAATQRIKAYISSDVADGYRAMAVTHGKTWADLFTSCARGFPQVTADEQRKP